MKEIFEQWLIEIEKKSQQTAYNYKNAINKINRHFKENENLVVDLYELNSPQELTTYVELYESTGKYSEFGNYGKGTNRAAIKSLYRFLLNPENQILNLLEDENFEDRELIILSEKNQNFSYEKDLKNTIIYQIQELFPNYEIYGNDNEGVEYYVEGKRIDILLESIDKSTLLAVELKSGLADYKVFGQISMYLGLLSTKFIDKKLEGCIVAGEIDKSLKYAAITNSNITLKSYNMKINLFNE
jgi:hypothetical protein